MMNQEAENAKIYGELKLLNQKNEESNKKLDAMQVSLTKMEDTLPDLKGNLGLFVQTISEMRGRVEKLENRLSEVDGPKGRLNDVEDDILSMNSILKFINRVMAFVGLPTLLYILYTVLERFS